MHMEKFSYGAVGHLCQHYDRSKIIPGETVEPSLTYLNYNLAAKDNPGTQIDKIRQRLKEAPQIRKKKDANVMCSWIITVPKDLSKNKEEQFFKEAYCMLADKYGRNNIVSAYVHYDEPNSKPHMHFCFVPVVYDQKLQREKVNAKECITRGELLNMHPRMQKYLEERLGCPVNIINEATKEGNKSIPELKRITASKTLAEAQKTIARAEALTQKISALDKQIQQKVKLLDNIDREPTEKPFFKHSKSVKINKDKYALMAQRTNAIESLTTLYSEWESSEMGHYTKSIENELIEAQERIRELTSPYKSLDDTERDIIIDKVNDLFNKHSSDREYILNQLKTSINTIERALEPQRERKHYYNKDEPSR